MSETPFPFQKSALTTAFFVVLGLIVPSIASGQTDIWKGGNGNWTSPVFWTNGAPNSFLVNGEARASTVNLTTKNLTFAGLAFLNPFRPGTVDHRTWLVPTSSPGTAGQFIGIGGSGLWTGMYLGNTGRVLRAGSWTARTLPLSLPHSSSNGPAPLAYTCSSGGTCWVGGASGVWSKTANWSNGTPTSSTNVLIDNNNANGQGASSVTLDVGGAQALNLTIDSDDKLSFNFNSQLTVYGGSIANAGQMVINGGSATNSELTLGANTTLSGGGTVTLNSTTSGGGAAYIQGNGFTLTNTNNTIQGDGYIGNGSLTLINQTGGTINANSSGGSFDTGLVLNGSGNVTNAGLLEATNSGILVIENTVNNTGGNITANGSSATVQLVGADIQGGTLNTKSGGTFITPSGNSSTLDGKTNGALTLSSGSTYTGDYNTITNILGTITNNGNFKLNGGSATNTYLTLVGNTTLSGSGGTVTLNSTTSGGGAAYIQGNGFTLTNTNNVIQGDGVIGNGSLVLLNQAGGTINANSGGNGPITTLTLNGSGGVTNAGLLEATNSGVLQIQNTINNTGGKITANGAGATVQLLSGATIQGGTLNTLNGGTFITPNGSSSTLDGKTKGVLTLSKGSTYTGDYNTITNVLGTITNNGNFKLNGGSATNTYLTLVGNTTLQGSGGTVTLNSTTSGGGAAYIQGNGFTLTNSTDTIQGNGVIGNGSLSLINNAGGTIFASVSGQALLLNGSGKITNNGTFKVASGALLHVQNGPFTNFSGTTLTGGTYNVAGTLQIDELGSTGGEIVTNAANIILSGTSSSLVDAAGLDTLTAFNSNASNGSFTINSGRNFTTAGNFTNNGTLTVGSSNSKFKVNGNLTNFSGTTLTGGTYNVTGALQFNGANIVTNAANITLSGTSSTITDQSGTANALANFATNNGSFGINSGRNFTTAGNFTNNGTLTVGSNNSKFTVNGNLTNFSGTTLTGGTYNITGGLQFNGANIVTNAANITLSGTGSKILDQLGNNGLASFATNNGSFTINSGRTFTTAGNFTNNGTIAVGSSTSKFTVNGNLTNFSGTTLTGGTYNLTGALQFNGANIVTNAATIKLSGTGSKIIDQSGNNGLAKFAINASGGSFSLQSSRTFATVGNFSNAGTLNIAKGTSFTVGGTGVFTQTGGITTDDGTLTNSGGFNLTNGSLFGTGTIVGGLNDSSGSVSPGDSTTLTGILTDKGAYTQGSSGLLDISIGGTTAGTQFDVLNATTASLNGTLNVTLIKGFVPKIGQTFKIMNFTSEAGQFLHCNCAINSNEHFVITYQGTDVLLTVVSGGGGTFGSSSMLRRPALFAGGKPTAVSDSMRSSLWKNAGSVRNNVRLALGTNEFRQQSLTSAADFRWNSKPGIRPAMSKMYAFSPVAPGRPGVVKSNLRLASVGGDFRTIYQNILSHPQVSTGVRIARARNDFQAFRSAAQIQPAIAREQFRALADRRGLGRSLGSGAVPGVAGLAHGKIRFGNAGLNPPPSRTGASPLRDRIVTGGLSWGLSNLLSKPKLGFAVQ